MPITNPMQVSMIELLRCTDETHAREVAAILDAAGVSYRLGTAGGHDIVGVTPTTDIEVLIRVSEENYAAARTALEEDSLRSPLPENHYLLSATDEELADVVGSASDWSPFDVAHARRLMAERGIDPTMIQEKKEARMRQLQSGKPASTFLLALGWISTITSGVIGLGIGWSLCYMKETTPEGEFYTYDEGSRKQGTYMMAVSALVAAVYLLYWALG